MFSQPARVSACQTTSIPYAYSLTGINGIQAVRESFPVVLVTEADHIAAARLVNGAVERGVALSTPDALIVVFTTRTRGR